MAIHNSLLELGGMQNAIRAWPGRFAGHIYRQWAGSRDKNLLGLRVEAEVFS
jgi:hypothetical protein